MKEKLTNNLGLKLLSLFCAFFVWLAVVNIANPVRVATIDIPVEIINEDILERANLTYEIVGKKSTIISYKVKTKDAYKVKASDFWAYADLAEMYDVTGAIPIKVEVLKNDELFQTTPTVKSPEVIKIKTEELQTKPFDLRMNPYGTPAEGYVAGAVTMTPDSIYVKGPVSLVGQISSVGIEFNIEGAVSDVVGTTAVIFYDANGNKLDLGESVEAMSGDIAYTLPILKVKNLPLDFVVTGEVKEGYKYTGIECSVKHVPVAGLKSALASLNNITVQSPELNIEGATADKVCEIDLTSYIDSNVQIAGMESTKITVTLKVEPLEEKTYSLNTADITLTGKSAAYDYDVTELKVDIKVRGLKEDLASLSTAKMNVSIDVSGMNPGSHDVKPKLILDDAYEVKDISVAHVLVSVKTTEDVNPTESTKPEETEESDGE